METRENDAKTVQQRLTPTRYAKNGGVMPMFRSMDAGRYT